MVETAFVLPVFLLFVLAIFEFGHAFMVVQVLKAAARQGARLGVADNVTTAEVQQEARNVMAGAIDPNQVTVMVKDAGAFDSATPPTDVTTLPNAEVSDLEDGDLFVVRVETNYSNVRVLRLRFLDGVVLSGQTVMRHE